MKQQGRQLSSVTTVTLFCLCGILLMQLPSPVYGDVNGGSNCAACTIIVSLSEQLSEIHNETVAEGLERLCNYLPVSFKTECIGLLSLATPIIQQLVFEKLFTPDVACHALKFCYTEPGYPECYMYPKPKELNIKSAVRKIFPDPLIWKIHSQKMTRFTSDICDMLPGLKGLCTFIEGKLESHLPVIDDDGDYFSTIETLRGSHFRGRDCNDVDGDIHPGRRPVNSDKHEDSNCNGIKGFDKATGEPYEEQFCIGSDNYGVVILGDSAGAHFHLPREWFSAVQISLASFKQLPMLIADEIDWPHLSAFTGYTNSSHMKPWPTDSVYLRLFELNRCNHRDYQNIAVNGADSNSMNNTIQYSMNRKRSTDYPAIVFYSLIGNDVCNGHADTKHDMTLPEDMKKRFRSTLEYLDTQLPNGSLVVATGLADGRILYDTLKDQIHPIGDWRKDITYPKIYNFLDCLQKSPCAGWMSPDEALRNFTSERATNLSLAVKEVAESFKATHFDVFYIDYEIDLALKRWVAKGGKASDLIEPVDGFHPSQVANFLMADIMWEKLLKYSPSKFKRNPHNAEIVKMFGDQGGY